MILVQNVEHLRSGVFLLPKSGSAPSAAECFPQKGRHPRFTSSPGLCSDLHQPQQKIIPQPRPGLGRVLRAFSDLTPNANALHWIPKYIMNFSAPNRQSAMCLSREINKFVHSRPTSLYDWWACMCDNVQYAPKIIRYPG